jgi:hypothetical protein
MRLPVFASFCARSTWRVFAVGTALDSTRTPEQQNHKLKEERGCRGTCGYAKRVAMFWSIISDAHFQPTLTFFQGGLSPEAMKQRAAARAASFRQTISAGGGGAEPVDLFDTFVLN